MPLNVNNQFLNGHVGIVVPFIDNLVKNMRYSKPIKDHLLNPLLKQSWVRWWVQMPVNCLKVISNVEQLHNRFVEASSAEPTIASP